jgi:hypothetical protein
MFLSWQQSQTQLRQRSYENRGVEWIDADSVPACAWGVIIGLFKLMVGLSFPADCLLMLLIVAKITNNIPI